MVKTARIGDDTVPVPGFGAMGLSFGLSSNLTLEEAEPVLLKALELGCTFWDTAVVYNAGINEKLLGDFIRKHSCRDKIFLTSKCGMEVDWETAKMKGVTNSAAHIKEYIEGTIKRLGFTPDLYLLHRIDPKTPLQESIGTLEEIRKAGKTRYIGLSEPSAATLRKANAIAKIHSVQAEYSAFETGHEQDGLIDTAKELGVAYVAYSPIGRGWLTDDFPYKSPDEIPEGDVRKSLPKFQEPNFSANRKIVDELRQLAQARECTLPQIAIAWVLHQGMIPIPGTTKASRLETNFAARDIQLTDKDVAEIRRVLETAKVVGERYGEAARAMVGN